MPSTCFNLSTDRHKKSSLYFPHSIPTPIESIPAPIWSIPTLIDSIQQPIQPNPLQTNPNQTNNIFTHLQRKNDKNVFHHSGFFAIQVSFTGENFGINPPLPLLNIPCPLLVPPLATLSSRVGDTKTPPRSSAPSSNPVIIPCPKAIPFFHRALPTTVPAAACSMNLFCIGYRKRFRQGAWGGVRRRFIIKIYNTLNCDASHINMNHTAPTIPRLLALKESRARTSIDTCRYFEVGSPVA